MLIVHNTAVNWMFGLSTKLITKGILATVKDLSADVSSISPTSEHLTKV